MKKIGFKLALTLCTIIILFAVVPISVSAVTNGQCGDNLTWTLDDDGTLTISGTGEMNGDKPWYTDRNSIKKAVIKKGVTTIGNYAFSECSNLTNISIPNSVTSIGSYAFSECGNLSSILIPNSVTSIENSAFERCSNLTSATIPDSVTFIGFRAFYLCDKLANVKISNNVTSINSSVFEFCGSLTEIIIPSSVTSIEKCAFSGCSSLTNITIANSVTSIGDGAFSGCSSLTNITIPSSVTSIAQDAFNGCKNLININVAEDNLNYSSTDGILFNKDGSRLIKYPNKPNDTYLIPNTVTDINSYAFNYCDNLIYIEIPRNIINLNGNAFSQCNNLETVYFNAFSCDGGSIYLPSVGNTYTNVFQDCPKLNIIFGEGITRIPGYIGATNANIPDSVQYIGTRAFSKLGISEVSLPNGLLAISDYAFADCKNLITVDMPSTVTVIGEYAFSGCSSLTEITIPKNAKYVKRGAFNLCTNLKTVILQAENAEFGRYWYANTASYYYDKVFDECYSLTNVSIGSDVKTIPSYFLYKCSKIQSVIMPNGVTSIGSNAFNGCIKLSNVYIPEGVAKISYNAFYNCSSLTSINIPNSVTSVERSAFSKCTGLTDINISNAVTAIESSTFSFCSGLQNISIPDNVTDIKQYAFEDCVNLTNIVIPQSVTAIKDSAFKNCKSLKDVYYSGDEKMWNNINIGNNNSYLENAAIHYNCSTIPVLLEYSKPENIIGGMNFASGKGNISFNYSDLYFSQTSYVYNHNLARASIRLALSAFAKHEKGNKYANQYDNVKDFLDKLHFINFEKNEWYDKAPSQNSIGVAIAEKGVAMPNADYTAFDDNYTILAVAIRGGGYENEWGGNFNVGSETTHKGFALARDQVLEF